MFSFLTFCSHFGLLNAFILTFLQRYYWTTSKWSTTLFPTDPRSGEIKTHRLAAGDTQSYQDEAEFLFQKGMEYDKWYLETHSGTTDEQGWVYAFDGSHFDSTMFSTSNFARKRDFVRRRRWLRKRQIVSAAGAGAVAVCAKLCVCVCNAVH